jgi:dihydrofolate synthase/folylpolyglutamate synthase
VTTDALTAIAAIARERDAPLIRAGDGVTVTRRTGHMITLRTTAHDYGDVTMALAGAHQVENALVAVRVLEVLDANGISVPAAAVASALGRPLWPGRLDLRRAGGDREILFDAAHNPAGAATLASYLREVGAEGLPLVFAAMQDKDLEGMLRALLPVVGPVVVTRASNRRSADPERLVELARRVAPDARVTVAASPIEALGIAWRSSPRIIVAGSIFLLGDVMKLAQQPVIPFENGS